MKLKISYLILFTLIANIFTANATIRYVSKTGTSTPPYTSWQTAADSIQKCISICVDGDTIYVANGIYKEQVVMINGLSLIGAGTDSCVIDTRALITSISTEAVIVADSCLFTGFNIWIYYNSELGRGVNANVGSGNNIIANNKIMIGSRGITPGFNSIVYNNSFENISIGVRLFNSNAIIRSNLIYRDPNTQTSLGVIDIEAFDNNYTPIIDSNYIEATNGRAIYKSFGSRPLITNNVITFTQYGAEAIYLSISDSTYIYNNLILIGTGISGIYNPGVPHLQAINNHIRGSEINSPLGMLVGGSNIVKNNIITNTVTGISASGTQNIKVGYNNLWNNNSNYSGFTPDTTNLSVNPLIVNDDTTRGELDFHLQAFSPLVDAGDPDMIDKDSSRIDIGLYGGLFGEIYKYQDLPPQPPRNLIGVIDSSLITIKWNPNSEADFSHYNLFRDTTANFTADSTTLITSLTDTLYSHFIPSGIDKFYYKLTAVDNQGNESESSEEIRVLITSVNTDEPIIFSNYILYQNYPNPFNPSTKIGYKLKERGYVKLYVYSVSGELVSVLVNQNQDAGYYEVEFGLKSQDSNLYTNLASGVYIYQIMVKNENNIPVYSDMKKMVLIK